jgi:thymidine kinase
MFSGKTEELIRLLRRAMHARKRVQVFKSALETRSDTTIIRTHDGICFNALAVPDARTLESLLEPGVQVIGIEEVQFFDAAIVPLCQRLADRGIQVIAAGLDQDFRGLPFGIMPTLMALADNVLKLHAICKVCGGEASRTQRLVDGRPAAWDEPTILIGADDTYEARCRRCHRVRNVPRDYQWLLPPRSAEKPTQREPEPETQPTPSRRLRSQAAAHGKNSGHGSQVKNGSQTATGEEAHDGTQLEMFPEIDAGSKFGEKESAE